MPAKNTRHTMTRQWELLKLLPSRGPGTTAKGLCERLNQQGHQVSKRQVERDLGELMEVFPIDCNNTSKPYGWRWVKDAKVDIPGIGIAEALSLKLMEGCMTPLLPNAILNTIRPRLEQAEQLLRDQSNPQAKWVDKIRTVSPTLPLNPPDVDEHILTEIQEALLNDKQIEVRYLPKTADTPNSYVLDPLAMIQRGPVTYLVAREVSINEVRLFAVHRFSEVNPTDKSISEHGEFDVDQYIEEGHMNFGSGTKIRLRAYIEEYLARILEETPLSTDQKIVPKDEEFYIAATIVDSWQLHWWILSHGDGIEIIGPKSLRNTIAETLKTASGFYEDD